MPEEINPELLQQLATLDETEVIVPLRMKREDVNRLKAVKLTDDEVQTVAKMQQYLFNRGYLIDNTFASLFVYCFNVVFTLHRQIAQQEAKKEEVTA